ncbi:uncharacterized protein LOC122291103 [Carya illinoinensis]|uniref:uncharacterized protein LOC122291103 n=1 Tax=Carya illinoinensis TaxID=32201 RepID=UPI001C725967|nr:uncharacterized protein LOC122291103 [Carya illinoinensis]
MSFISWNSRGLGNPLGVQALSDLVRKEVPEILFLQKTKLHARVMERLKYKLEFHSCLAVNYEVTEEDENVDPWWLTGFYGNPDVSKRHESWNLLRSLQGPSEKGWLILGDLNEIISNAEKSGGRDKPDRQMKASRDVIDECHLYDLGFNGNPFTWCNRREMDHCISERLDRFLSNLKWHSYYPMASVTHGVIAYSDHVPIILKLTVEIEKIPRKKLFRFEAMWVDAADCKQVIQEAWRGIEGKKKLGTVMRKIQHCGEKLTVWNKNSFGHVQRNLRKAKERLFIAHQADPLSYDRQKIQEARNEVQKWLARSEVMWRQRSKALWLAKGDKNSRSMDFLQGLAGRLTSDMVEQMDMPFTEEESVVGKDVTDSVLHALNNGQFPSAINHTYVTLIPKRKNPELVSDYRPISLSFVPGRLITDNMLVAYEMVHFLRRKRKRKDGFMSLKLDMSKAYDRTVSFSILVNGEPNGPIFPTRGLRQRDPISPYIFLLCTEGLILLLDQANSHNQVEGIRVCRGAPMLNHLLFADDVVMFCRVNMQTCLTLQHKLDIYEKASGQKINSEKTSMVFNQNVNQSQQEEIMQFWGVHQFQQYDKYLGLPSMVRRAKQGWRIMTQESSLLHRIFKARYFPTSSFKDSKLGGAPSFVWRGIWEAKTNLLKGCRWRVGNGISINIWTDYWRPNHKLVPVTTTTATSSISTMENHVASLMMQNPRRWDMKKVRSLIPAREANEVLCVRLPSENVPDTLVWEHEKSGMYSVKSAYQFFFSMDTDRQRV